MMNRVNLNTIPPAADRPLSGKSKRGFKRWFIGIATLFGIVLVGCSQGTYPVDIFYEQHYQQSYRSHEPPRLTGVAGAVAFYPPIVSGVTNTGDLGVLSSSTLRLLGALTNNADLTINRDGAVFNAVLRFDENTAVDGTGQIILRSTSATDDAQITSSAGFTGTIGAGQTLVIMEAMKMEHAIKAPADGVVSEIFYAEGDQVAEGAELIAIDTGEAE